MANRPLQLQTHYDNANFVAGRTDSSGVRVLFAP
jgi:hypothetical protein